MRKRTILLSVLPASISALLAAEGTEVASRQEPVEVTLAQAGEEVFTAVSDGKKNPWSWNAALGVKETYDSNVFLQNETDRANEESFVTTGILDAGVAYQPNDAFNVSLKYNLNAAWYSSHSSESHFTQKVNLDLNGSCNESRTHWRWNSALVEINGDDVGLAWDNALGGAPAGGGIPVRNRRDTTVWLSKASFDHPLGGQWFIRPLFSLYIHDWHTKQFTQAEVPGYLNYVDRNDFHGGFDFGYEFAENTSLILGYRIGHQNQATAVDATVAYANFFQRALVGLEGNPADWLSLSIIAGPDFRSFANTVPAGFQQTQTVFFYDLNATVTVSPQDKVTLLGRQYMQPGFGGQSIYEDITLAAGWSHELSKAWDLMLKFNVYRTDFLPPAARDDLIYTPSLDVNYRFGGGFLATASYSYDWSESRVPNTPAREFTRHLVSLGLKYPF